LIDHIEYNSERPKLIIPEYGRHIQKMVDQAIAKETKEERNKVASSIIAVMGNLNPHLRDVTDFQHKLWDQLFIISDFKLDVDSPYPIPNREELQEYPQSLEYPQNFPKYRFYGNNIKRMIDVAISWEDGEKKEALVLTIANHMKKCFLNWNKDTVEDDVIFKHLFELSEGKLYLKESEEELLDTMTILKNNKSYGAKKPTKAYKNPKGRTWKKY
jgi:phage baseplate assembly protein W